MPIDNYKFKIGQRVMLVSRTLPTSQSSARREREPFTINRRSKATFYGNIYCQDDTSDWCSEQDLVQYHSTPHTRIYK